MSKDYRERKYQRSGTQVASTKACVRSVSKAHYHNTTTCRSKKHLWTKENIGVSKSKGKILYYCKACRSIFVAKRYVISFAFPRKKELNDDFEIARKSNPSLTLGAWVREILSDYLDMYEDYRNDNN